MWNKFLLLILFTFIVWGCNRKTNTTKGPIVANNNNTFKEERIESKFCTTKVKFKYQDPTQNLSGNASVRIVKDSAVWISISVLFGFEAARMLFLPDRLLLNNKLEGTQETILYKNLSQTVGTTVSLSAVEALVLGNSPIDPMAIAKQTEQNDTIWKSYIQPVIKLALLKSNKKLTYLVTQSGQTISELNYTSFRPTLAGQLFAYNKEVTITNPKGLLTVKLEHLKIDFPTERPEMPW
jgi:hypothetical protein